MNQETYCTMYQASLSHERNVSVAVKAKPEVVLAKEVMGLSNGHG